jgi:pyruvate dehydrogenase E1 component beta subunit
MEADGNSTGVIELGSIAPLDRETLIEAVSHTGCLLVVDEDYETFGLSGELAAVVLDSGFQVRFGRVCTQTTIPYARHLEDETLPNVARIYTVAKSLLGIE